MNTEQSQQLHTDFDEGPAEALPIALDEKTLARQKRNEQRAERLANAKAYEQLGLRLLKFKVKKYGEVGQMVVSKVGIKNIGHGTIVAASENAERHIEECDAIVKELMARQPPCDPEVITGLMQLIRDFNRQILDSGEAHIRIDRQPNVAPEGDNLLVPFPPGTPIMIGVAPKSLPAPPTVEADGPEA